MLVKDRPVIGFYAGQYVKVGKIKGYILDTSNGCLTVLATKGAMGIQQINPRFTKIKVLADRTPEGIKDKRKEIMLDNIKMGVYVLVPISLYIGFATNLLFLGVGAMGLIVITAAFLEDCIKNKGGLF